MWINPLTGLISGTVAEARERWVGETTTQTFSWLVNASPLSLSVSVRRRGGNANGTDHAGHVHDPRPGQLGWRVRKATITCGDGKTSGEAEVSGGNGQFTLTAGHVYEQTGSLPVSIT